eukprot:ctg_1681.g437
MGRAATQLRAETREYAALAPPGSRQAERRPAREWPQRPTAARGGRGGTAAVDTVRCETEPDTRPWSASGLKHVLIQTTDVASTAPRGISPLGTYAPARISLPVATPPRLLALAPLPCRSSVIPAIASRHRSVAAACALAACGDSPSHRMLEEHLARYISNRLSKYVRGGLDEDRLRVALGRSGRVEFTEVELETAAAERFVADALGLRGWRLREARVGQLLVDVQWSGWITVQLNDVSVCVGTEDADDRAPDAGFAVWKRSVLAADERRRQLSRALLVALWERQRAGTSAPEATPGPTSSGWWSVLTDRAAAYVLRRLRVRVERVHIRVQDDAPSSVARRDRERRVGYGACWGLVLRKLALDDVAPTAAASEANDDDPAAAGNDAAVLDRCLSRCRQWPPRLGRVAGAHRTAFCPDAGVGARAAAHRALVLVVVVVVGDAYGDGGGAGGRRLVAAAARAVSRRGGGHRAAVVIDADECGGRSGVRHGAALSTGGCMPPSAATRAADGHACGAAALAIRVGMCAHVGAKALVAALAGAMAATPTTAPPISRAVRGGARPCRRGRTGGAVGVGGAAGPGGRAVVSHPGRIARARRAASALRRLTTASNNSDEFSYGASPNLVPMGGIVVVAEQRHRRRRGRRIAGRPVGARGHCGVATAVSGVGGRGPLGRRRRRRHRRRRAAGVRVAGGDGRRRGAAGTALVLCRRPRQRATGLG